MQIAVTIPAQRDGEEVQVGLSLDTDGNLEFKVPNAGRKSGVDFSVDAEELEAAHNALTAAGPAAPAPTPTAQTRGTVDE